MPALLSRLSKATPQGGHPKCAEAAGDKNFVKTAANSVSRSIAEMLSHFADEVILPALLSDLSVKAKPASGYLNFDFPVKSHGNSIIPMENRLLEQFEIETHVVPGAGEYGVLTRPRSISPTPKMITMCHFISMTPCVISPFGPDWTRSVKSSLLP